MAALGWLQRLQMGHQDAKDHYIKLGIAAERAQVAHSWRVRSRSPHRNSIQVDVSKGLPTVNPRMYGSWMTRPGDTFGDLKQQMETTIGIPAGEQRLLFEVHDDQSVADPFVADKPDRVCLTLYDRRRKFLMDTIHKMPPSDVMDRLASHS